MTSQNTYDDKHMMTGQSTYDDGSKHILMTVKIHMTGQNTYMMIGQNTYDDG